MSQIFFRLKRNWVTRPQHKHWKIWKFPYVRITYSKSWFPLSHPVFDVWDVMLVSTVKLSNVIVLLLSLQIAGSSIHGNFQLLGFTNYCLCNSSVCDFPVRLWTASRLVTHWSDGFQNRRISRTLDIVRIWGIFMPHRISRTWIFTMIRNFTVFYLWFTVWTCFRFAYCFSNCLFLLYNFLAVSMLVKSSERRLQAFITRGKLLTSN